MIAKDFEGHERVGMFEPHRPALQPLAGMAARIAGPIEAS